MCAREISYPQKFLENIVIDEITTESLVITSSSKVSMIARCEHDRQNAEKQCHCMKERTATCLVNISCIQRLSKGKLKSHL